MAKKETRKEKTLRKELRLETLRLTTSALSLVAALAWNEFIKQAVDVLIKPIAGKNSGVISLFIYAVIVTILAVGMTYSLTRFLKGKN